ncbi:hypothetical protein L210DRAFT_3555907 [Boletus edulis BED1]|uniref:F-box domain-containing protein n=1 Tax=Boletus edulis BED1 TaxID=1328754 RepID=A0AAD4GAH6_BOLED|nr:hypothetical protein L210DRAFT_3555907 [Boletus edulis BED1]
MIESLTCRECLCQMLSIQGVTVPKSKEICSLPIVRYAPRSLHAQKYTAYALPMPVEIIANILGFASCSSHDPISQSIALSHVCRQWRQISLSMPSLWTFIKLSLPLSKSQLVRMCTWIIRSRNCPLDIHMDFRDPSWDWDEASHIFGCKVMEYIMCFLVPQAQRWRSTVLLTDTWAPIFMFLSCTVAIESAPLLQTIRLARCNEYFVAPGETFRPSHLALPVAWFRGGASLSHVRHVSLSGVHVDWTRSGLTGLRELELRYHARDVMPALSEFLRILRANAALERLVILGWGPQTCHASENERGSNDLETIELPNLEELEFGFADVTYAIDLLSLFALPKLRVLSVQDVAFAIQLCERQDSSALFNHLVEMSAPTEIPPRIPLSGLCELSLRGVYADAASIRGLFGSLCAMTSLCLDRVDPTPLMAICSALDACDRLEMLTLKDIDSAAAGLVLSSCSFPSRLRIFLDIDDDDDVEQDEGGVAVTSGM